MKTEIQFALSEQPNLYRVYGFGSFFRDEEYRDIDLLLVSKENSKRPLDDYYSAQKVLNRLSRKMNVKIDVTFLTYSEFLTNPLLEMDNLVAIVKN